MVLDVAKQALDVIWAFIPFDRSAPGMALLSLPSCPPEMWRPTEIAARLTRSGCTFDASQPGFGAIA